MTVSVGDETYTHGVPPCVGRGVSWTQSELQTAISDQVAVIVYDDEGTADIEDLLLGVAETEFEQQKLADVLQDTDTVENWRVGEAVAETYLTDHRSCTFPWPDGRDARKRTASLPGADLVGFQLDSTGIRFAFGEVKTSGEKKYPPQAMHGRTGLKQQIEDLRDREDIRDDLLKYLGHRAGTAAWKERYQAASKRYLSNSADVQLFGILVRDVDPNTEDLRVRVEKLAKNCPKGTSIELMALYLPGGAIEKLATMALTAHEGADS